MVFCRDKRSCIIVMREEPIPQTLSIQLIHCKFMSNISNWLQMVLWWHSKFLGKILQKITKLLNFQKGNQSKMVQFENSERRIKWNRNSK